MNHKEIEQYLGCEVFLVHWPFTIPVNTAEGKEYDGKNSDGEWDYKRRKWTLIKLTKMGKALVSDGEHTFGIAPSDVNYTTTLD